MFVNCLGSCMYESYRWCESARMWQWIGKAFSYAPLVRPAINTRVILRILTMASAVVELPLHLESHPSRSVALCAGAFHSLFNFPQIVASSGWVNHQQSPPESNVQLKRIQSKVTAHSWCGIMEVLAIEWPLDPESDKWARLKSIKIIIAGSVVCEWNWFVIPRIIGVVKITAIKH